MSGYWWRGNGGLVITDIRTPEEIARDRARDAERFMELMMRAAHWEIDKELFGFPRPVPRLT